MQEPGSQETPDWIVAREGISLMASDDPATLRRALACFDESIALREALLSSSARPSPGQSPGDQALPRAQGDSGDCWPRYNLAGSWINKGDVLAKLIPRPPADDDALRAFDRALEVLAPVPDSGDPRFRRRHTLAWLKRSERLIQASSIAAARASASRAIELIARAEREAIEDALLSLKARLISGALGADADDEAEHALALASHWRADRRVVPFAREFFRIGAEAYALRQPQFLGEYLREWQPFIAEMAGAASASAIAETARALAFSHVANRAFATLDQAQLARTLATLRELRTGRM